jgi:hypothetical protein
MDPFSGFHEYHGGPMDNFQMFFREVILINPGRRYLLWLTLPMLIFFAWFGWMTYSQSRINWIEVKVNQAMAASMVNLAPHWPRIETFTSVDHYFQPNVNDPIVNYELYRDLLAHLNQEESIPPVKVTQVSIRNDIGNSEDTLVSQALIQFPLVAGFESKVYVQARVIIPHYKTLH